MLHKKSNNQELVDNKCMCHGHSRFHHVLTSFKCAAIVSQCRHPAWVAGWRYCSRETHVTSETTEQGTR